MRRCRKGSVRNQLLWMNEFHCNFVLPCTTHMDGAHVRSASHNAQHELATVRHPRYAVHSSTSTSCVTPTLLPHRHRPTACQLPHIGFPSL